MKRYSTLDNPIVVPVQTFAYALACRDAVRPGDAVLDVGFGLGYGLGIIRRIAGRTVGVEIDERALALAHRGGATPNSTYLPYDGLHLPFASGSFDAVTCIDVLEHVERYADLLAEMVRVARRCVFISTPNRRPENTNADGTPRNYWHLREWTFAELGDLLGEYDIRWQFINGPNDGPYAVGSYGADTQALVPMIHKGRAPIIRRLT